MRSAGNGGRGPSSADAGYRVSNAKAEASYVTREANGGRTATRQRKLTRDLPVGAPFDPIAPQAD